MYEQVIDKGAGWEYDVILWYLAGVPHGMMIGQVHELVNKIWLVQVTG